MIKQCSVFNIFRKLCKRNYLVLPLPKRIENKIGHDYCSTSIIPLSNDQWIVPPLLPVMIYIMKRLCVKELSDDDLKYLVLVRGTNYM